MISAKIAAAFAANRLGCFDVDQNRCGRPAA
jgi:hypothetical protein